MIKSIYLNYENIKKFDNLKDIIENWEISKDKDYFCDSCYFDSEAVITKNFVLYPQILIIALNDETEKEKKWINFQIELNINNFAFKYKLIFAIISDEYDQNFNILKCEGNNFFSFEPTTNSFKTEEFNIYSNYPRVLFYEKTDANEVKSQLAQTEKNVDDYFNKSLTTNKLINNTRMKKSMEYCIEESNNMNNGYNNGYEIFNIKNKENSNNNGNNNKNPYEKEFNLYNKDYPDDDISEKEGSENLLKLSMNKNNNIPLTKEEIEKFGDMENIIKFINSQNKNNSENLESYDEGSKINDAFKDKETKEKLELISNLQKTNPNFMNEFNLYNNNNMNNMNNIFIQNNFNYYNQNQINPQKNNNPYQNKIINYNNDKESFHSNMINNNCNNNNVNNYNHPYQNSSSNTYTNKENISIKQKKEIRLEFISSDKGIMTSLIIYNENIMFIDVIGMLRDKIPEIKNKNIMFLCNGNTININKSIKENGLEDGYKIIMIELESEK